MNVLACSRLAVARAEVVVQRGCGDRRMAHRDADLVQRVHDVAGRIDALAARALLLIDRDTAAVAHAKPKRLRKRIFRVRAESGVHRVKAQPRAVLQARGYAVLAEVESFECTLLDPDAGAAQKGRGRPH